MKRLHVHVSVDDIPQAIGFYSALFAAQPSVVKPDYAKWMLDDPRVNFAISMRGRALGLDHLGIQVEDQAELHEVYARLDKAGGTVIEQGETTCCYAKSEKSWIDDPAGIAWETFLTTGESTIYGDGSGERSGEARIAQAPNAKASNAKASNTKASNTKASNTKASSAEPRDAQAGACCAPQPVAAKASACCNS
jgi:catechol 2,3-dioxygenase-like lactoylglutathione lyase family enzyme